MPEDSNTVSGKIPGRAQPEHSSDGRIGGRGQAGGNTGGKIPGNKGAGPTPGSGNADQRSNTPPDKNVLTRKDRIAKATAEGGLKSLPQGFGDSDGDWQIIDSENLFETLYLDQDQIVLISPEIVKNNYNILENFWKEKKKFAESGSSQVSDTVKEKYGAQRITNSTRKLTQAFEQLFTLEKIQEYHTRLNRERIRMGALKLEPLLKMMVKDGEADASEIEGIIEEGHFHNLNKEEVAGIIKNVIDTRAYKPYGQPSGTLLSDQLLSVSWMSDERMKVKLEEDKVKKNSGREILDNAFAYSVEEIGEIIFNHEKEAKIYIANGLLKNSIDYFSPAKANQFVSIINTQKNEHLRYLQAAYRLKPELPYRFSPTITVKTPKQLVGVIAESLANFRAGKEQFKGGQPEVWLLETNKEAYHKIERIRQRAENADAAFIEFLYTFDPELPYRFNNDYLVKTPEALSNEINYSAQNWEAGKKELYTGQFTAWLQTAKQSSIPGKWNKVKKDFLATQDLGLEHFLHLLNETMDMPKLGVNVPAISLPKIQSGQVMRVPVSFHNETRGHIEARLALSKPLPGVSISAQKFTLNNILGKSSFTAELTIDSNLLLKGYNYESSIVVMSDKERIEIPISFKIVFPRNAFILETAKYAGIGAVFFLLVRLVLSYKFPAQVSTVFPSYADWDAAVYNLFNLQWFGWTFLLFFTGMLLGIYFLAKFLIKK